MSIRRLVAFLVVFTAACLLGGLGQVAYAVIAMLFSLLVLTFRSRSPLLEKLNRPFQHPGIWPATVIVFALPAVSLVTEASQVAPSKWNQVRPWLFGGGWMTVVCLVAGGWFLSRRRVRGNAHTVEVPTAPRGG